MARSNVITARLSGQLGRLNPSEDAISGLVTTGIAVSGGLTLNTSYKLRSIKDLEALKVDAAYDTTNNTLLWHHVDRYFKRNPGGELWIRVAAQTVTIAQLVTNSLTHAKQLSIDADGKIKLMGICRNPSTGYTATLASGLDTDVVAAIPLAQALIDAEAAAFRFFSIILEGRSLNGTISAALDLRNQTLANQAAGVSVALVADPAVSARNVLQNGYAAVGDVLGIAAKAAVSQNVGERNPAFNLQNTADSLFLTCGLSNNTNIKNMPDADLTALHDKGFIIGEQVAGLDGFYLNDDPTVVPLASDYAYLCNNRTINKAIALARKALLPRVNSRIKIDNTGKIDSIQRLEMETAAKQALAQMEADGDISGGIDAYIDPLQNLLSTSNLQVQLTFIPMSIGRTITLNVGFKSPLKA